MNMKSEIEDLTAMTDLANLIRKKAFYVMRTFNMEAKGEKTLDHVAGIIAVSILMDRNFIDAVKSTLEYE